MFSAVQTKQIYRFDTETGSKLVGHGESSVAERNTWRKGYAWLTPPLGGINLSLKDVYSSTT